MLQLVHPFWHKPCSHHGSRKTYQRGQFTVSVPWGAIGNKSRELLHHWNGGARVRQRVGRFLDPIPPCPSFELFHRLAVTHIQSQYKC